MTRNGVNTSARARVMRRGVRKEGEMGTRWRSKGAGKGAEVDRKQTGNGAVYKQKVVGRGS